MKPQPPRHRDLPLRPRRARGRGRPDARRLAPAVPAPAAEDARLDRRQGPRVRGHDRPRPLRRAAHRGALARRPVLRPGLRDRPGPALAARVLPPRGDRPRRRVRGRRRARGRPPDAHARLQADAPSAEAATIDPPRARSYSRRTPRASTPRSPPRRALPLELQLLRIDPEPWTPADSLAIGKVVALGFSTNMETELFRAELVSLIGAEKVARLEPQYPRRQPGRHAARRAVAGRRHRARRADRRGARSAVGPVARARRARTTGSCRVSARPPASRCWRATRTSRPRSRTSGTRSSCPRPTSRCAAARCPAPPALVIGQSAHVAWGFTNVMADVQDLYVERIRSGHEGAAPRTSSRASGAR